MQSQQESARLSKVCQSLWSPCLHTGPLAPIPTDYAYQIFWQLAGSNQFPGGPEGEWFPVAARQEEFSC